MLSLVGSLCSLLAAHSSNSFNKLASASRRALVTAVALVALAPLAMQATAQQQLAHHVRPAVATKQAAYVSAMPEDEQVDFSIVLPLRNQTELSSLLTRLYDPTSPDYRHFLSVEEFTSRFGPTAADYQAVIDFAQANGFTVTGAFANRLVVPVHGSIAQVNAAFNVHMNLYRHPTENRTFYSPDREPSLDLSVAVAHIAGLNNYSLPHPTLVENPNAVLANITGSGPSGSYLGSDMRSAYYGGSTLKGTGQSVGIVSFVGYDKSDVDLTFTNASQSYSVPVNKVLLDGVSGASYGSYSAEPVLDIVQTIGMAPGLDQVRVYIGNSDVDILSSMASENIAKQLSCSWSWLPDDPAQVDPIFLEFAAQGQSFLAASGDNGAFDASINYVVYPQEDAFVTSVGGTHLTTTSAGGAWSSETSWNSNGFGSSGGISLDGIGLPSYQNGLATATNGGSTTLRNVPDVAMEGDFDNYYCYSGACYKTGAGTSFAAPRWAGFIALVNQQALEAGNAPAGGIGFLNPALYSVATGTSYSSDFHDITVGNNLTAGQSTWFSAVAGYDLVTGWGSPTGQNLIDALAGPQVPGFWLEPAAGVISLTPGKSATNTVTITDAGSFTGNVNLAVTGLPTGVTASWSQNPASSTTVLTLSADSSITTASSSTITITGTSGSVSSSTKLEVDVHMPTFTIGSQGSADIGIGSTGAAGVYVTPQYGFSGPVTFSVSGLPAGVTASFSPNPSSNSSTTLSFTASSAAAAGSSTLTITGTSGSITATTTLTLTLHQPSFSISTQSSIDLGVGSTASGYVSISPQYGFSGSVALSISGLPAGVSASFSPNPSTGYSTLNLTASGATVVGSYSLTITGTSGSITASTTVTLNTHLPTFTLYGPNGLDLGIGATTSSYVYVTPQYGFTANVALTATGLPAGVTATFSPNPATGSASLLLSASSAATIGASTITVTGTSGSITSSFTVILNLRQPTFSISSSSTLDIGQSHSGQSYFYVQDLYGFTGAVTFSTSALPSGATTLWNPNPTTNSTILTVTAAATTPTGQYPITITGTSGSQTQTSSFTLGVHTPAFTLSTGSSVTVGQGSTASGNIWINTQYGFNGSVTLSASGLPSGVTATISPNPTTGNSTITFNASSTATTGQYNVTITGTSGTQTATTSLTLTVAAPSFSLSNYATVNVGQGASATTYIYVNAQNGFTGSVNLAASGLPSGVSASFSPNPTTGTSVLTLTASGTAATGQYNITVTGTSGSITASTNVTIGVYVPTFTFWGLGQVNMGQGTSTTASINISPQYGFTGSVGLALSGLPDGVTASFSPNPTTGSSTITFTAASTAALGQYTVTLTGTSGSQVVTTTFTLGIYVPTFSLWGGQSISLGQGASATSYLYLSTQYGFNSPVTFTIAGLPDGVTATFSPNPTTASTTLTLSASSTATLGQYNVTVTGTSGTQSASLNLSVGIYVQSFTMSAYPSTLTMNPGSSGTAYLYISGQYGFSGSVTLAATGLPSGVTASFSSNPTTGNSNVTFAVASNAAPSTSTVTITGVSGALSVSVPIVLIVNTPGITLTDSPSRITLVPGQSEASTVTITGLNGYTGNVTLAVSGLPSGVTATVSPNPASTTATVTLTASSSAQAAAAAATITGTSGSVSATVPITVLVTTAPATTATTLKATTGGKSFTSVAAGTAVTLTAGVTAGSTSLTAGQVLFCEDSVPVCDIPHSLGAAQIAPSAKAAWVFVPGPGSHSIRAVFEGFAGNAASTSDPAAFKVTAPAATTSTVLTQSGSTGNYSLTATVTGVGLPSPTGTISFDDVTNGNSVLGSAALQPSGTAISSSTTQTPATGISPTGIVSADFNGDGIPDLAIPSYNASTITILLGNGDGTFTTVSSSPTVGTSPTAIVAADFNRDGRIDLAVASGVTNSLTILLGNGNGTFTPALQSPATGSYPAAIAVGDFNGDGLLDLAVVNSSDNTVTILLGNGNGSFTAASQTVTSSYNPISVAAGDFNGDGVLDLAVANFYTNTVSIFVGNGDGTFAAASSLATASYPRKLAVADLDGDGKQDLLVLCNGNTLDVFMGNGDGTFGSGSATTITGSPLSFALSDFNGDGKIDLAVTLNDTKSVAIMLGNGDGTFTAAKSVTPATGSGPSSIVAADFNGDGIPDVAVSNASDSTVSVSSLTLTQSASATATGISPLGNGNRTGQASYPGDSAYKSSLSNTLTLGAVPGPPTVTVSPASAFVSVSQSLGVTVSVSGGTVNPTPTGSVEINGIQQNLFGGTATITIPAGSLSQGSATLAATYTPDTAASSYYTTATGSATVTVTAPVGSTQPTITVTPTPATVTDQQSVSVVVTVAGPTGGATPGGTVLLVAGSWSSQQLLSSGSATFTIAAGTLTSGTNTLTAHYSGDSTYNNGTANATVKVSAIVVALSVPQSVSPGSSTTASISLSAGSAYSGTLQLGCTLTQSPSGAKSTPTCTISPASVALTAGGSGTSTLTIHTTAASTALLQPERGRMWGLGLGGPVLAIVLFLGIPIRRRRWLSMFVLLVGVALIGGIGCGGGGGSSTGGGGGGTTTPATTAGDYTFTITAADSTNSSTTATATVVVTVK